MIYQPRICATAEVSRSVEALLRWDILRLASAWA